MGGTAIFVLTLQYLETLSTVGGIATYIHHCKLKTGVPTDHFLRFLLILVSRITQLQLQHFCIVPLLKAV